MQWSGQVRSDRKIRKKCPSESSRSEAAESWCTAKERSMMGRRKGKAKSVGKLIHTHPCKKNTNSNPTIRCDPRAGYARILNANRQSVKRMMLYARYKSPEQPFSPSPPAAASAPVAPNACPSLPAGKYHKSDNNAHTYLERELVRHVTKSRFVEMKVV